MAFQIKDHYFQRAKEKNYLARSVFKLQEIDKKFNILQKGFRVLDLGYYPGSWIQYTSKAVGAQGFVCGIDLNPPNKKLARLKNVTVLQHDIFCEDHRPYQNQFDVILSDMAPNTSGIKSVDQAQSLRLMERVFSMLPLSLKKNGRLVVKVFDSQDAQDFLKEQKTFFKRLSFFRPKATRTSSKEGFAICHGYRQNNW